MLGARLSWLAPFSWLVKSFGGGATPGYIWSILLFYASFVRTNLDLHRFFFSIKKKTLRERDFEIPTVGRWVVQECSWPGLSLAL